MVVVRLFGGLFMAWSVLGREKLRDFSACPEVAGRELMTFQSQGVDSVSFSHLLTSTSGKVTQGLQTQGNIRPIPEVVSLVCEGQLSTTIGVQLRVQYGWNFCFAH
jgi:hypothetical protein